MYVLIWHLLYFACGLCALHDEVLCRLRWIEVQIEMIWGADWDELRCRLRWMEVQTEMNWGADWDELRYRLRWIEVQIEMNWGTDWDELRYRLRWIEVQIEMNWGLTGIDLMGLFISSSTFRHWSIWGGGEKGGRGSLLFSGETYYFLGRRKRKENQFYCFNS